MKDFAFARNENETQILCFLPMGEGNVRVPYE